MGRKSVHFLLPELSSKSGRRKMGLVGVGVGALGGLLAQVGAAECNYRAANGVKIDSPWCAAGSAEWWHQCMPHPHTPPLLGCPPPSSPRALPSWGVCGGQALAVRGSWEDVPAKWHTQSGTRKLYLHPTQTTGVTHSTTRVHLCIIASYRFNTLFTEGNWTLAWK